jgi:hypothetical protein
MPQFLLQLHRLSSTLVQATTYSQSLSNLQLLVGFIHAHRHAQDVLRQHIRVSWQSLLAVEWDSSQQVHL